MEDCIFNSMDPAYRNPFGAVSTGTTVDFTIHIPLDLVYATAILVLYDDGMERRIPLESVSYTHLDVYKRQVTSSLLRTPNIWGESF